MNEACLEKRDASCVLIQDARRDTRRMITRDEKCLISCVFRKEMVWWVGVEERRKSFFPFDFRSVRKGLSRDRLHRSSSRSFIKLAR